MYMGFLDAVVTDLTNDPMTYVLAVMLLLAGGVATLFLLRRFASERRQITWTEFAVVGVVIALVQVPLVNVGMTELARHHAVGGYQELWGGSYTQAYTAKRVCSEDDTGCGPTRQCHPYQDKELDYVETVPDPSTYNKTTKRWESHSHEVKHYKYVTKYHQCPYISFMTQWILKNSFGDEHIVDTTVPLQPQAFEGGHSFIGFVTPPSAPPAFWSDSKVKIERGDIVPAQKVNTYKNPLLAAQSDQLDNYSDKVDYYRGKKLLVDHTMNVHDPINGHGFADQVVFVRQTPGNAAEFELAQGKYNAEFGNSHFQGDMNTLVVRESDVPENEAQDFANAQKAYWQSPQYGKAALAKNAVMVVLGVSDDFQTIKWAQARTGIGYGNQALLMAISQELPGKPFTPQGLYGNPTQSVDAKGKVTYVRTNGELEKIVMVEYPFKRPCMLSCDAGQEGGFEYVSASVMMTTGDYVLLWTADVTAGGLLFLLVAMVEFDGRGTRAAFLYVKNRKWRRRSYY